MILGILRETKQGESRVICTPQEVAAITAAGHTVYAQRGQAFRMRHMRPRERFWRLPRRNCLQSATWSPRSRSSHRRNGL